MRAPTKQSLVRLDRLAFGLLACSPTPGPAPSPDLAMRPPDLAKANIDLALTSETVVMNAIGGSGQSGTAVLTDNGNGTTTVKITTTGGTDAGMQAAHIHIGTCGSNGAVYAALTSLQAGASTTTVAFPLSSLIGGKYYINVHNSANVATIQTCGNIQ